MLSHLLQPASQPASRSTRTSQQAHPSLLILLHPVHGLPHPARSSPHTSCLPDPVSGEFKRGLFFLLFFRHSLLDAWIWLGVEDGEVSVVGGRVADRLASEDGGLMESQGDVGCVVCCVQRHVHVEERERERMWASISATDLANRAVDRLYRWHMRRWGLNRLIKGRDGTGGGGKM
jgi:hypothetical protein